MGAVTTTATPEPPDDESPRARAVKHLGQWALSPSQVNALKSSLERSTEQISKDLSPAMKALLDSGKVTRVEISQVRELDPEHPPEGETEGDVQSRLLELARQQLDATTEANAILKKSAEDESGRAAESEGHAKTSKRVAIASFAVALLALFGALPQGIAAFPDAWAVITGGWPPAPPSP